MWRAVCCRPDHSRWPQTAAAAPAAKAPAQAKPWKKIAIPPLHAFKPEQPKRIELANGLVIFLEEDHELPFIDGSILIRGGSREEPAAKIGLVSLYGEAWRTSGTAAKSGDALDAELAQKAAAIETGGGLANTSVEWSSFKQDFDSVFGETVDLLLHPAFKAEKLALAKRGIDTEISRRNDEADEIAGRESTKLVYGAESPYARQAEYATVDAVTLDDLKAWHDRTVVPNGMIVSVEGDFDSAAMEAKLRKAFGPLPRGAAIATVKADFAGPKPGVYFVDKEDVDQSSVQIVGIGTERSNPDYYALNVMNEVFSGGFGSRVFQYVRTKLGLAYDGRRQLRSCVRPSGRLPQRGRDEERQHGRRDPGGAESDRPTEDRSADAGGAAQGQGRRDELVHLPLRHAGEDAERAGDAGVLRLSAGLPGKIQATASRA